MESRYANPLSRHWGIHLQKEYHPSDSSTVADYDDDIVERLSSMEASSLPLSSTLPSSHGQPQSNSSETLQCATTKSDQQLRNEKQAMKTGGTSRIFKRRKVIGSGNKSCLAHSVWSILPGEHRTNEFFSELEKALPKEEEPAVKDVQGVLAARVEVSVVTFRYDYVSSSADI